MGDSTSMVVDGKYDTNTPIMGARWQDKERGCWALPKATKKHKFVIPNN